MARVPSARAGEPSAREPGRRVGRAWLGSEPSLCPLFAGPTLQGSLVPSVQWMKTLVHLSWSCGEGWRRPHVKEQLSAWLKCGGYAETCRKEGHSPSFLLMAALLRRKSPEKETSLPRAAQHGSGRTSKRTQTGMLTASQFPVSRLCPPAARRVPGTPAHYFSASSSS